MDDEHNLQFIFEDVSFCTIFILIVAVGSFCYVVLFVFLTLQVTVKDIFLTFGIIYLTSADLWK